MLANPGSVACSTALLQVIKGSIREYTKKRRNVNEGERKKEIWNDIKKSEKQNACH